MTTQEMRELDAWIAEHVMGWKYCRNLLQFRPNSFYCDGIRLVVGVESVSPKETITKHWMPTISPKDAMDVLKKCAEKHVVEVYFSTENKWRCDVKLPDDNYETYIEVNGSSQSLELSICLLAKQLFSQTTK